MTKVSIIRVWSIVFIVLLPGLLSLLTEPMETDNALQESQEDLALDNIPGVWSSSTRAVNPYIDGIVIPIIANGDGFGLLPSVIQDPSDGQYYEVDQAQYLNITVFDVSGFAGTPLQVELHGKYIVENGYTGTNPLRYRSPTGAWADATGITPLTSEDVAYVEKQENITVYESDGWIWEEVSSLQVRFDNNDPISPADWIQWEAIWLEVNYTIPEIVINEVMYDPPGNDDSSEWIELYNSGGTPIDLSDWRLQDGNGSSFDLTGAGILPVGGYLVAHLGATGTNSSTDVYGQVNWTQTFKPGPSDSNDTRILESGQSTTNYGSAAGLTVDGNPGSEERTLIKFNLSIIPPSTPITHASLHLYLTLGIGNPSDVSLHQVNHTWNAGTGIADSNDPTINGTTWCERWYGDNSNDGNSPWDESDPDWATPGGDFDAVAEDVVTVNGDLTDGWYSWIVTDLAGSWVNLSTPNYGMLLKSSTPDLKTFKSAEETPSLVPKFVVNFPASFMLDNTQGSLSLKDGSGGVVDFITWGGDPGTDDDEAVSTRQWTDGFFINTSDLSEGQSLGRDSNATDTDLPDDWQNATGKADPYGVDRDDAFGATPGWRNWNPTYQPDLWINGSVDNLYMDTPVGQQVQISYILAGDNATWWITLQNDGYNNDTFDFQISSNMLLGWAWELSENITWKKINNGDNVSLSTGERRNYTLNISSPISAVADDESWVTIRTMSQNGSNYDSVKGIARILGDPPPEISNVQDQPDPQDQGGYVNITCTVTDDVAVDMVKANISGPAGFMPVNTSMISAGGDTYYHNVSYSIPGTYTYFIWANDTGNNENTTLPMTYTFVLNDITLPIIANVQDSPDPQDQGGYVNITCTATDNVAVDTVKANISGPTGFTPINISMTPAGGDTYYYNISYFIAGTYTYFIWANDTGDNKNSTLPTTYIFVINDITSPEISNVQDTPDPQDEGGYVNITCTATDNVAVDMVMINISGPGGFIPVNVSMQYAGSNAYYYNSSYSINGTYIYFIWANDTSDNENSTLPTTYTFAISETTPPKITNVADMPDPQNPGGYVNITCTVTDNVAVNNVMINISGPGGFIPVNVSMQYAGSDTYYHSSSYSIKGTYTYFIWANDTLDNENSTLPTTYAFTISDITPPEITNIADTPDPQNPGGNVNITCTVIDNEAVDTVKVNISGPAGFIPVNTSMLPAGSDAYYHNVSYSIIGTYTYFIWANDTNDIKNSTLPTTYIFMINDTIPPEISNVLDAPDPQGEGGYVNITCTVVDNVAVNFAMINITGPGGFIPVNVSMQFAGSDTYYYNSSYSINGTYTYFIWANDTSDNNNISAVKSFNITTPAQPDVDYIQIQTAPGGLGVVVSAMVYDLGETDVYFAAAYNITFGYQGEVVVSWISNNEAAGTVNPSLGNNTTFTAVGLGTGIVYAIYGFVQNSTTFEVLMQSPQINGTLPDIGLNEDFGLYQIDLSQFASDYQDSLSELEWYLTGVDLSIIITAGENLSGNHIITLVSKNNMYGNMEVTYWLLDTDGNTASQTAWINVSSANDPPVIANPPDIFVHFDSPYSFDYSPYISDIDNPLSDLTLQCNDIHTTVDNLVVTYTYPQSMLGEKVFVTITVSDGIASTSDLIMVTITSDYPPVSVADLPDVTLLEGETRLAVFDLDDYFMDPDGDTLYMSYGYTHLNITIHDDHTVDFSALGEWFGTEKVTFRGEDPTGAIVEQTINVVVIPVNDPPILDPLPPLVIHYNYTYVFDLLRYISDYDNEIEELVITTSNPNNVTVTGTQLILFYPECLGALCYPYTVPLIVYVSDGINTTQQATTVTVDDNYPPRLVVPLEDQVFNEDEVLVGVFDLDDYFIDVDSSVIFYTYGATNIYITIHEDHTVDLSAAPNWFGSELIAIRATDDENAFLEETITIIVLPVNDPPVISEIPLQVGVKNTVWTLDLTDYIYDVDDDLNNLTVEVNSTYVTVVGHMLIFDYPENITEDTIWITVSDGELETTAPVEISILPPEALAPWPWYIIAILSILFLMFILVTRIRKYNLEDIFLIHRSGTLISYVSVTQETDKDKDIIANMFVAVQEFVKDAFSEGEAEALNRMDYGDKKVLIHRGEHVILAVFITGQESKSLLKKMEDFVSDVEERYIGSIERLGVSLDEFEGIEIMLQSFQERKYIKGFWREQEETYEEGEEVEESEAEILQEEG